ncbi:MAG: ATP-dependent RecD-like DNA helicase [Mobilitalea sp.]
MSDVLEGYIERIIFRNDENGYTVLNLHVDEEEVTCVGSFPFISEGEFIMASGSYTDHPVYGQQFIIERYDMKQPEDLFSVKRYLGSGAIKGIGAALADRIVNKFKEDTFRIIENEPERLVEIKGISDRMAKEIYSQFEEKRDMRSAMLFLQKYNITGNLAVKIYTEYGQRMYDVLKENPYRMAEDIAGVGFKTADEIARQIGIGSDSDYRVKAGILYALLQASSDGHVYLPEKELLQKAKALLMTEEEALTRQMNALCMEKKIIINESEKGKHIYSSMFYYMELNVARMLHDLNIRYDIKSELVRKQITAIEDQFEMELEEQQRTAVAEAASNGLLVITGGPGTGKTTTINTIIKFFESEGMDILLAAPTGRAAKRMTETTGYEARTIHRLLELSKLSDDQENKYSFERNESNPLETDVLIIDEMSMVDINLMHSLLKAVCVGTRLILVGDVNQLPSVGPGNVLKDIIDSHSFNIVKLTKIFRQAADSDIITNAHKINDGESIKLDNKSRDFFFLKRGDSNVIAAVMINLIKNKLPNYVNATPFDIQVLTPMRKGELGVERLNQILQKALNVPSKDKKEKEYHDTIFREGDKVMQIKNNYQIAWEVRSKYGIPTSAGTGVFNGDAGVIKEINLFSERVMVEYEDNRIVEYNFNQLDELELAYAVTIHKSQGSEYPAVILPILDGPKLLFNRNLLYTAVTRAKSCVMIVGSDSMLQFMIDNKNEQNRYSGLCTRIKELN